MMKLYISALLLILISIAPLSQLRAEEQMKEPQISVKEKNGDWETRCLDSEGCAIHQIIVNEQGAPVSEINVFKVPDGGELAAAATLMTPLGTLLTKNVVIKIDNKQAKIYPFTFCTQIGCIARIGLSQADLSDLKAGSKATITIVPVAAPTTNIDLKLSLSGFTAGFNSL